MIKAEKLARFVVINCKCGQHIINLDDCVWSEDTEIGFYSCNGCHRPLVCRGDDGKFYYVGNLIK